MAYINNLGQVRIGVRGWVPVFTPEDPGTPNTIDQDSTNFIIAAGISDSLQTSAIETLVSDLKAYGLWTKMKAIYPFVGGSAASHKFNLKDPRDLDAAYRLVFNGGWTHTSNGAKPNGTTGYADTKLNTNILSITNSSFSLYLRTVTFTNYTWPVDLGVFTSDYSGRYGMSYISQEGNSYFDLYNRTTIANTNLSAGFIQYSRTSSSLSKVYYKNTSINTNNNSVSTYSNPNNTIYLGALHLGSGLDSYSNREQAFISIGDGLSDSEAANLFTVVQKFQTTLGRHVGTPYVSDPDAIAFLMTAGITDGTQASAINTLVIRMKADGVWTKMKAIYPFVGGTAASHKWNLKDPRDLDAAYRLVFNGGWTHTSSGVKPNGSNAYAMTHLSPSTSLINNNYHLSYYSRDQITTGNSVDIGCSDTTGQMISVTHWYQSSNVKGCVMGSYIGNLTVTSNNNNTLGLLVGTRTSSSLAKQYMNGIQDGSSVTTLNTYNLLSRSLVIGGNFASGGVTEFTTRQSGFVSIGDGLSDIETLSLYTSVQEFQTTLGRQVNIPLVSDTDAQAFLNAANITSFQQASAVNKLVIDLKAAGVWTKMKAIYPFVGGSAASHKFNLKDPRDLDAAYRLSFNGGWTHTSTGALPNGTTGYANTYLNTYTNLSNNNTHDSIYVNNNISSYTNWPGFGVMSSATSAFYTHIRSNGNYYSFIGIEQSAQNGVFYSNDSNQGFYINSRISSTSLKGYKNGILKNSTSVLNTGSLPSNHYYYGARFTIGVANNIDPATYNNYSHSFASIGDGLTDSESASFYTAVQTYQTSLGRAVNTPVYNNGLVLNLDAGNANSYPGTGTTWFDLAAGNNGTLVNGPTYDATNGGSILFDGVNDYVDLGSNFKFNDTDITYDFWFKVTDNSDVYHEIITLGSSNQSNALSLWKFRSGSNSGKVFINICVSGFTQTIATSQLTGADILNTIVNYTAVFKKESGVYKLYLYRNGVLDATNTSNITSYNMNNWSNFEARIGSGSTLFPELWKGNIYSGKVWSRALSATEILNNFNSTRGRFGL